MKLIWYGTAAIGIESQGQKLLIDPFLPLKGSSAPSFQQEFQMYDKILITHGHLDHIGNMKEIFGKEKKKIFCTKTPAKSLKRDQVGEIHLIRCGSVLHFRKMTVTVCRGRHVSYDLPILKKTFFSWRFVKMLREALQIGKMFRKYPENQETVGYFMEAEGKTVFVMGSLNLDPDTEYPKGMDVCILPYQGCSTLLEEAEKVLERLAPKSVFLDHFDDTFPPISAQVDTMDVEEYLQKQGIVCIKPEYGKTYSF